LRIKGEAARVCNGVSVKSLVKKLAPDEDDEEVGTSLERFIGTTDLGE
jgi:hypothetical protein